MHKAEIANHVHNPEFFVACRRLHYLFGRWHFNQRSELQLRADWDNVLRVILHRARRLLRHGTHRDEDHENTSKGYDAFHGGAPYWLLLVGDVANLRG